MALSLVICAGGLALGIAQHAGSLKREEHPKLSVSTCTASGCISQEKEVVIDQNWRWVHKRGQPVNCYTGNQWDTSICPDPKTCAANCEVGAADTEYASTYGVTTNGDELKMGFVTQGAYSKNVGSRNFLMDDESTYYMFKLKNKEFTFDVDVSKLPCGLNGAVYFVEMDADGGMAKNPTNKAGAKYGTGYCDAQCPQDVKFINGEGNVVNWTATGPGTGVGQYGACCTEMDVWEANSISTAYTAHSCTTDGHRRCEGDDCGNTAGSRYKGLCDKNGCDLQTYRLGNTTFFGKGGVIDTLQKVTVVTQFITEDGTDSGDLKEIRRHYVQNGKKIGTPELTVGSNQFDSISTEFCEAEAGLFKDHTNFLQKGGLKKMGEAMEKGMVLVLSLWDDHEANMLWLDSTYPAGCTGPGCARGPCPTDSGKPGDVENNAPDAAVTFSNIRFGDIGTTDGPAPPSPPGPPAPAPSGSGKCCWGGCSSASCKTDWCGQSEARCTGDCSGEWCPSDASVLV